MCVNWDIDTNHRNRYALATHGLVLVVYRGQSQRIEAVSVVGGLFSSTPRITSSMISPAPLLSCLNPIESKRGAVGKTAQVRSPYPFRHPNGDNEAGLWIIKTDLTAA